MEADKSEKPTLLYTLSREGDRLIIETTDPNCPLDVTYRRTNNDGTYETRVIDDSENSIKIEKLNPDGKRLQSKISVIPEERVKLDTIFFDSQGKPLSRAFADLPFSGNFSVSFGNYQEALLKKALGEPTQNITEKASEVSPSIKYEPKTLQRYSNFAKYIPKLQEIMHDDIIKDSEINNIFATPNERRGVKAGLIFLSRLGKKQEQKSPVERIGRDYKVLVPDIFSQILGITESEESKAETPKISEEAVTSKKERPLTPISKYCVFHLQELIKSSENNKVKIEDLNKVFKKREEKITYRAILTSIEKKNPRSISQTKKGKKVTGFQFLRPELIMDIKVSEEEAASYVPIPLGSRKYMEYALTLKENAFGSPLAITENDFEKFLKEKFGKNKGSMMHEKNFKDRIMEEEYLLRGDHKYTVNVEKFSKLTSFFKSEK
jgi:hypothetical protein